MEDFYTLEKERGTQIRVVANKNGVHKGTLSVLVCANSRPL